MIANTAAYPPCEVDSSTLNPRTADNGYPSMDDWQIVGRATMTTEQITAWYEAWYATTTEAEDYSTRKYSQTAIKAWNRLNRR